VKGRPGVAAVLVGACAAALASSCGAARQDSAEPKVAVTMQVIRAAFPAKQAVAKPTAFELRVRNASHRTAPNVAVTLDSFDYAERFPELADPRRPVWVIERGPGAIAKPPVESEEISPPGGGQTAYVNTWALGPLAAGATQTFRWLVAPVKPGTHTVHFTVAAGLAGKAEARLASGGGVQGQLTADIAPAPTARQVDPNTGRVVPGTYPGTPVTP
jgi:hypothetical protein